VIAAAGPTPLWYAARSTGFVAMLLLTAVLGLGILTSMRWGTRDWPRFLSQALHRNLSLLVLVFLFIHIAASVIDPFAGISILNTVAPFTGDYRPVWLGLGVLSTELLVALTITSLLRQRIGFTTWRVIHWMAYACWPLAMLHTLGTGSDVRSGWAVALSLGSVGAVVIAIAWRLFGDRAGVPLLLRLVAMTVCAAATVALLGFAAAGPLHSGWARAAGTPDRLLAAGTTTAGTATAAPSPSPAAALTVGLNDQLTGTVGQRGDSTVVSLADSRDANLKIAIAVSGRSTTGQLTITEGGATICNASASVLQGVQASCAQVAVSISLMQAADGSITGQMTTTAVAR
jgi:hypothetical protein